MGDPAMLHETSNGTDDICNTKPLIMIEERYNSEKITEKLPLLLFLKLILQVSNLSLNFLLRLSFLILFIQGIVKIFKLDASISQILLLI